MAHTRRKSNGCRRGKFKPKTMGKGWASHRKKRGCPKPVVHAVKPDEVKPDEVKPDAAPES